jgi:hypothetical protein
MVKHPIRTLIYAVLLFFSLSYPITTLAALVLKADAGDQQITLQWATVKGATNYGVCVATQAIADINNCLNYAGGTWQDVTNTTVKITPLTNGKKYYARVLAETASSALRVSNTIAIAPIKPGLNDTGITTCSDDANNNPPCPVTGFPGQDAQSGRDVSKNNDSNGHAGFDFTKISKTGAVLAANASSWNCVRDNVTGLMWEVKTDANWNEYGHLHNKSFTYSWYEPDNSKNGGFAGVQNGGSCASRIDCDTDTYVKAINAVGWCGYKDWRLPSKAELQSIVNYYGDYQTTIDATYFPNTVGPNFWSSTPVAGSRYSAWIVNGGSDHWDNKDNPHYVRLVRSGQ